MHSLFKTTAVVIGIGLAAFLAGCTNTSGTLNKEAAAKKANAETTAEAGAGATNTGDGETDVAAKVEQPTEVAKVINKPGKVANRGGYIRVLVNDAPITNFDVQRRASFLKLRRVKGNRQKVAENEMIEQSLKLAAARRANTLASDQEVEEAFRAFAKRNRATPAVLSRELGKLGVGAPHFKEFIRTQISWSRTVQQKFRADTRSVSQIDAITQIRKQGSEKPELAEYHFQQIVFVIPKDKRASMLKTRRAEAQAFRQRFTSCKDTQNSVKTLRDVVVRDRRRVMEPEIPPQWQKDVAATEQGGATRVQETENGVEFIAICERRMVSDDRAAQVATQAQEFESFNEKGSKVSQDFLNELRSQATIVYR